MEQELWKDITVTNGHYSVSNYGRVRSNTRLIIGKRNKTVRERVLKQRVHLGYCQVNIYIDRRKLLVKVHRLVAAEFLENPNNYNVINHKDSNPLNNHVNNLEWCTQKHNMQHSASKGRMGKVKGENSHFSVLTQSQVNEIRTLLGKEKISFRKVGRMYNCHHSTISNIISGKTW